MIFGTNGLIFLCMAALAGMTLITPGEMNALSLRPTMKSPCCCSFFPYFINLPFLKAPATNNYLSSYCHPGTCMLKQVWKEWKGVSFSIPAQVLPLSRNHCFRNSSVELIYDGIMWINWLGPKISFDLAERRIYVR